MRESRLLDCDRGLSWESCKAFVRSVVATETMVLGDCDTRWV